MKHLIECKDMDSAGALKNAIDDCVVDPEGFKTVTSLVSDQSGHNWVTGWFVKVETVLAKEPPDHEMG